MSLLNLAKNTKIDIQSGPLQNNNKHKMFRQDVMASWSKWASGLRRLDYKFCSPLSLSLSLQKAESSKLLLYLSKTQWKARMFCFAAALPTKIQSSPSDVSFYQKNLIYIPKVEFFEIPIYSNQRTMSKWPVGVSGAGSPRQLKYIHHKSTSLLSLSTKVKSSTLSLKTATISAHAPRLFCPPKGYFGCWMSLSTKRTQIFIRSQVLK